MLGKIRSAIAAGGSGPEIRKSISATFDRPDLGEWYSPVMLGAATIGRAATSASTLRDVREALSTLSDDDYVTYLAEYYRSGQDAFGDSWGYADIVTALRAVATLAPPANYLEIGVRRGRSMAMVAAAAPECEIVGFDMWVADYAGIDNPGPDFVASELVKVGHTGTVEFISGDSHETVPDYFKRNPDKFFDLITVDGDHTPRGAERDLRDVMPHLSLGGVLVFDDIAHPAHPELAGVWDRVVTSDPRFTTWSYSDVGYGVAVAVRKG